MNQQILLIGHGSRNKEAVTECRVLAMQLASRVGKPVHACFLEFSDPPIIEGIQACVDSGVDEIIALPLFLGPAGHQKNDVPAVINWAREEYPNLSIKYGVPLGAQYNLMQILAQRAKEAVAELPVVADEETAVLVVGRGSSDPESNADVAKLSRLLYEGRQYKWVMPAYYSLTTPSVADRITECKKLGAKRIIILPNLLFTGRIYKNLINEAEEEAVKNDIEVVTAHYLFPHDNLVEAIAQRYFDVVGGEAKMTCDLCKYRNKFIGFEAEFGLPQTSDASHGMRGVPHRHANGTVHAGGLSLPGDGLPIIGSNAMDGILPPQYRGGVEVSSEPMEAADLVYTNDGSVAWNAIWEDFCDLALAGGPPHREDLLEPANRFDIEANIHQYNGVVAEIERGIELVTGIPPVKSKSLGWVGIPCKDDKMAIWLMRAIIVENVLIRRENNILYLPAGHDYTLKGEIKNVISVVAKTFHYYMEHMAG